VIAALKGDTRRHGKKLEKVYITPKTIYGGILHLPNYKTGYSTP